MDSREGTYEFTKGLSDEEWATAEGEIMPWLVLYYNTDSAEWNIDSSYFDKEAADERRQELRGRGGYRLVKVYKEA